ncbi:YbaB/EbfC family nucleoid-associated protein [Mycolicibacterium peregrinum]
MTLQIPGPLQWVSYLVGSQWPKGDEDAMYRIGGEWGNRAEQLRELIPELNRMRAGTSAVLQGVTAGAADKQFALLFDGDATVDKLAEAMAALGELAESTGKNIEYTKLQILTSLAIAAFEISWAMAQTSVTFGASAAQIPIIEETTSAAIHRMVSVALKDLMTDLGKAMTKTTVHRIIKKSGVEAIRGSRAGTVHPEHPTVQGTSERIRLEPVGNRGTRQLRRRRHAGLGEHLRPAAGGQFNGEGRGCRIRRRHVEEGDRCTGHRQRDRPGFRPRIGAHRGHRRGQGTSGGAQQQGVDGRRGRRRGDQWGRRGLAMDNDAARHELIDALALVQEQFADLAAVEEERAALSSAATRADGTVTVTVDCDGVVIHTAVSETYLDNHDLADLGRHITDAAQDAARDIEQKLAELLAPLVRRREQMPSLSDIVDGAPDIRDLLSTVVPASQVEDESDGFPTVRSTR